MKNKIYTTIKKSEAGYNVMISAVAEIYELRVDSDEYLKMKTNGIYYCTADGYEVNDGAIHLINPHIEGAYKEEIVDFSVMTSKRTRKPYALTDDGEFLHIYRKCGDKWEHIDYSELEGGKYQVKVNTRHVVKNRHGNENECVLFLSKKETITKV